MNKVYKERMERADDAANQFFEEVKKTGDMKMLENDDEIRELYLKAYDVVEAASEEEKHFNLNYNDYYLYKGVFMIHSGVFANQPKKSFTSKELKPVYDELTAVLDGAIEKNDRHKPAYIQRKADVISSYNEELTKYGITVQKGGCYIATAVYGSYDCPQVWTLRRYRDGVLANSLWGRAFIHVYYALSPTLVKWFGHRKWFSGLWRGVLDTLIYKLHNKGYVDMPYTDLTHGSQQVSHIDLVIESRKERKEC